MAESLAPFVWGSGGSKDSASRRRQLAEALMRSGMDASPVQHWTQGLARLAQALVGGYEAGQADKQDKANNEALATALTGALAGSGGVSAPAVPAAAPSMAGGGSARTMAMPNVSPEIKNGIVQTASALGISPVDLATTISYETGGTFDPTKAGPTTKWGQHRGLIQFGEPQARQYGVDWSNPVGSQLGPNGAVAAYLRDRGVKPGMGLMDIYSTVNAGAPGLYNRSDAAAGGAPGTVADKVNNQMAGHRAKAQALFADLPAAGASPVSMETGQGGFAVPQPAGPAMTGATFNAITNGVGNQPLDPVFQTEGISQPWMGTALAPVEPAAPAAPQMVQAPLPPVRPTDLADIPAAGAVPAMGQMPAAAPVGIDPNSNDAGSRFTAGGGAGSVPAVGGDSAFTSLARALSGGAAPAETAAANPGVQNVAQAVAPQAAAGNPLASIAIALARSGDRDGAVKLATSLLQPTNGVTIGERLVDPRTGRVIADFTGANGGRSSQYGLNPVYGVDKDGKPVIMQIGAKGDAVATKLPAGVSLATGVDKIDAGTHFVLMDKRTGQPVGTVPKNVAGEEQAKVEGKSAGEAKVDLPRVIANAEQMLGTIEGVRNHPGRNAWGATGATAAWPLISEGMPGSPGRDFVRRVDQIKGKAFLEAFNSLKGGGQITETEGQKATDAIARLDRAQSAKGFDEALNDLEEVVRGGMARARAKAGQGGTPATPTLPGDWQDVGGVRIRRKQ